MKKFPLRDILTVTTGRLLTKSNDRGNGIEGLYDVLNYLTGDEAYTHTLGRFAEECKPWLLRWFPKLAEVDLADLDRRLPAPSNLHTIADEWLAAEMARLGLPDELPLEPIPKDDHDRLCPIEEFEKKFPGKAIIVGN